MYNDICHITPNMYVLCVHTSEQQTAITSAFKEVLTHADDQLIEGI